MIETPGWDAIRRHQKRILELDEIIELAEEQFGTDWSAAGSDLDPTEWDQNLEGGAPPATSERGQLINNNRKLLAELTHLLQKARVAIKFWEKKIPQLNENISDKRKQIKDWQKRIKGSQKAIKTLKKRIKNSKNKTQIKQWKKEIGRQEGLIKGWKKGITSGNKDITYWDENISNGRNILGDMRDEVIDLEGYTGRGGRIQDVRMVLETLGYQAPPEPPGEAEPPDAPGDSELADLLREQLRETQRALAISQAQMPIFERFMPKFHQGGIVQGRMGSEQPIMAKAGEGVFTPEQMRAMGSQNITVVIEDAAIDSNRIRVEVDGVIQDKVSTVRRQGSNRKFVTSR